MGIIKEARLHTGMTQKETAQLLGVSLRCLQEWEDERRVPKKDPATIAETIKAFGILTEHGKQSYLEGVWSLEDVINEYKHHKVKKLSAWGAYGATYEACRSRIPAEVWNKLTAEDLAKLVDAFKAAYDDGYQKGAMI